MAFKRILVPVDYSEPSRRALELALTLDADAEINVIHAWDRPSFVTDQAIVNKGGAHIPLGEMIRENAEREMSEFLASVTMPPGKQVAHHLVPGEPVTTILAEAGKAGYDVVVVGTHGRTGMTRLLLGSVTEKLLRLSPIPVLSVPCGR